MLPPPVFTISKWAERTTTYYFIYKKVKNAIASTHKFLQKRPWSVQLERNSTIKVLLTNCNSKLY